MIVRHRQTVPAESNGFGLVAMEDIQVIEDFDVVGNEPDRGDVDLTLNPRRTSGTSGPSQGIGDGLFD
jgi:hypothetical protein